MRLLKLEMHRFGKFAQCTVELSEGLMAKSLENEAGKSTMSDFIYYIFYGFEKSRAKRALEENLLEKYQPWDSEEGLMGALELEKDGKIYRIERSQDKKGKGELRVMTADGTKLETDAPGEYFLGVDAETFRNVFYICQGENTPVRTGQMDVAMKNLVTTGNEEVSFDTVMERLLKEKLKYSSPKRGMGKIRNLQDRIQELKHSIALKEDDGQDARLQQESEALEQRLSECEACYQQLMELEKTLKAHQAFERQQKRQSIRVAKQQLMQQREGMLCADAQTEKALQQGFDLRQQLIGEQSRLQQREQDLKAHPVSIEPKYAVALEHQDALIIPVYKKVGVWVGAALTLMGAIAGFFMPILWVLAVAGAITAAVFGISMATLPKLLRQNSITSAPQLRAFIEIGRQQQAAFETYQRQLSEIETEKTAVVQDIHQINQELSRLYRDSGIDSPEALQQAKKNAAEYQALTERIALYDEKLQELKAREESDERIAQQSFAPLPSPEQLEQDIRLLAQKKEALLSQKAQNAALAERFLHQRQQIENEKAQLTAAKRQLAEFKYAHDVVCIAIEQMQAAQDTLRENYAPLLRSALAEKLRFLTDGKYDTVVIDEELGVRIKAEGGLRPLGYFSSGTRDAVYLALRLSLAEIMEGDSPLPMIFDDPFLSLDENRWKILRSYLEKMGRERQILFFSCRQI